MKYKIRTNILRYHEEGIEKINLTKGKMTNLTAYLLSRYKDAYTSYVYLDEILIKDTEKIVFRWMVVKINACINICDALLYSRYITGKYIAYAYILNWEQQRLFITYANFNIS